MPDLPQDPLKRSKGRQNSLVSWQPVCHQAEWQEGGCQLNPLRTLLCPEASVHMHTHPVHLHCEMDPTDLQPRIIEPSPSAQQWSSTYSSVRRPCTPHWCVRHTRMRLCACKTLVRQRVLCGRSMQWWRIRDGGGMLTVKWEANAFRSIES